MNSSMDFPDGSMVKNPPGSAGDAISIPGSGRSPGKENDNPLHYSCLKYPMDRGTWWAAVHRVTKRTRLSMLVHISDMSETPFFSDSWLHTLINSKVSIYPTESK